MLQQWNLQLTQNRAKEIRQHLQTDISELLQQSEKAEEKTGKKPKEPKLKAPKSAEEIATESSESYNFTDPDTRVMRKSKSAGYTQSINAQASVDADGSYLIVGQHISQSSSDGNELLANYHSIPEQIGKPSIQIADAGYVNIAAIKELTNTTACEPYVSVHREDAHHERRYDYRPSESKSPKAVTDPTLVAMKEKLETEEGKLIYKLRAKTVETVFGIIKSAIGFRGFTMRGLEKMTGEWELISLSYNCKRLHTLMIGQKD